MAQLIQFKRRAAIGIPDILLAGEPLYNMAENAIYIGTGSAVVRFDAGAFNGDCSTAAATAAKVVACPGIVLLKGVEVTIKFTATNTVAPASLTLNVGGTGPKEIKYRGANLPSANVLSKNRTYKFRYNGTDEWELIGDLDTDTTVGAALSSHTGNSTIHITGAERTKWNAVVTDFGNLEIGGEFKGLKLYSSSSDSYMERVILLLPYVSTNTAHLNHINGNITASKQGSNVIDFFKVRGNCVWNSNIVQYESSGQRTGHKLVTCIYNGVKWIGLKLAYSANPQIEFYFYGIHQASTSLDTNKDALKVISYYNVATSTAIYPEIYSSLEDFTPYYDSYWNGNKVYNAGNLTQLSQLTDNIGVATHIANTSNPHSVTKAQVGLGSVENTALSTYAGSTTQDWSAKNLTLAGAITGATTGSFSSTVTANNFVASASSGFMFTASKATKYNGFSAPAGGGFIFLTNGEALTGSAALTILANRYVGINNADPIYNLDVTGTGRYTSNLSVGGTLGVTGNTTLSGTLGVSGETNLAIATVTNKLNFGSNGKWINLNGSANLYDVNAFNLSIKHDTPFIDFYFETDGVFDGQNWVGTSRIIERAASVLDIEASVKIPSSKYWQIGDARLTYETVGGVGFLKLAHSNGTTAMHLVTTGGQTMYSTGVPATGGGGGAIIQLNGATLGEGETAIIYSPTSIGYPGYILKAANPSGLPVWDSITNLLPDASTSVKGVAMLAGSGSATTVAKSDHNHTGIYATASHGHETLYVTNLLYNDSNSDPQNMLIKTGANDDDILLGNGDHETIIYGSSVKLQDFGAGFIKSSATGVLSVDTNTYSLSSHTHSYLPLSGGTVTGFLSVNRLSITNEYAVSHLAFGRASHNYITMPASGLLGILPNGERIEDTNGMWFSSSGLFPGTNNTFSVGTSSNRFAAVHATTIYEAGTALSSKYAASSHTHNYLPLTGGTISGNLVVGHATDLNYIRLQTGVMSANPALGALTAAGIFSIVAHETYSFGLHTWVRNTGDCYLQTGRGDALTQTSNIVLNLLGGNVGIGMVPTTKLEVAGVVQSSADYFTKAEYGGLGWKNSSNTVTNYLYLDDADNYIHFALGEGLKINNDVIFSDGSLQGAVINNYGVCATAAATATKTVTITGFRLATGVQVNIKFTSGCNVYPSTLNVSGTGAKPIETYNASYSADYFIEQIAPGAIVTFVYDGTRWVIPSNTNLYT